MFLPQQATCRLVTRDLQPESGPRQALQGGLPGWSVTSGRGLDVDPESELALVKDLADDLIPEHPQLPFGGRDAARRRQG
jgi:hypothetical protein